jgi:hypothetical protein
MLEVKGVQIMFMLKGLKEMSSGMILKMKKILQFCFKNKKTKIQACLAAQS